MPGIKPQFLSQIACSIDNYTAWDTSTISGTNILWESKPSILGQQVHNIRDELKWLFIISSQSGVLAVKNKFKISRRTVNTTIRRKFIYDSANNCSSQSRNLFTFNYILSNMQCLQTNLKCMYNALFPKITTEILTTLIMNYYLQIQTHTHMWNYSGHRYKWQCFGMVKDHIHLCWSHTYFLQWKEN